MGLATWQAGFAAALDTAQEAAGFRALLADNGSITLAQGLDVYRRNACGTRVRALEAVFPVIRQVLGAQCFAGVATHWVAVTPSDYWDLNRAGRVFPDHLAALVIEREEYAVLPWLSDLARLEWLLHRSYYQPDAYTPDFAIVEQAAEPGRLVPQLAPSVELMRTTWPVLQVWEDHQPGGDPGPLPEPAEPFHLVIHRPELRPRAESVSQDLFTLLVACRDGWNLDQISQAAAPIAALLPELMQRGWLIGFREPGQHVSSHGAN